METRKTNRGPGIKQWRFVIRNLPFTTNRDEIKELVSPYGKVVEINLPKCKDPRFPNSCAGFCFVQFSRRNDAERAQLALNFSEFKKRKIAVDWSIDKDNYVTLQQESKPKRSWEKPGGNFSSQGSVEVKQEPGDIKVEPVEEGQKGYISYDEKEKFDSDEYSEDDDDDNCNDMEERVSSVDSKIKEEEEDDDYSPPKKKLKKKEPPKEDPAVVEGRVIFLRNVPFDATDEDIRDRASEFGEISLAITCKYPDTGLPNGSAFIHFIEKESADKFLEQLQTEEGVLLNGRKIYGHRAVSRSDAASFKKEDRKLPKDKRNLYLLRASFIRPGTAQANDMSEKDSEFRERLALTAKNKLKNLLMYVSPNRIIIHNIPFQYTDEQLRKLCIDSTGCLNSDIIECRIMRKKKGVDERGKPILGKSKGYAFVGFKNHPVALQCLQKLNNNATIFKNERRPIVEFSIESLQAVRLQEKRQNRSLRMAHDNPDVAKTKQTLMAGGKKWLPKRLGAKIRHKVKNKNNKKSRRN